MSSTLPRGLTPAVGISVGYLVATLAYSWPLAANLSSALPGDYGDPVFIAGIMAWVGAHLTDLLQGNWGAWEAMWDAPFFAPETDTLTYSDNFLTQASLSLPVYWVTGSALIAYNLQFIGAFLLSAVATHVLTWRLTFSHWAGFVAGVLFAFNPSQTLLSRSHLQTLSIGWWVVALAAIDTVAETRSRRGLVIAAIALLALNLASSYYLAYTPILTAFFAVWSLHRHARLRDLAAWRDLAICAAASTVPIVPILGRYLAMREALGYSRTIGELVDNSVNLARLEAAAPWFAPFVILAVAGVIVPAAASLRVPTRWARGGLLLLGVTAMVLSLGPRIEIGGLEWHGPYTLLYEYVPGFQGLRVVNRFVMLAMVFFAVLAGITAAGLAKSVSGTLAVIALVVATTYSTWTDRLPMGKLEETRGLRAEPSLAPGPDTPKVYQFVARLPSTATIIELPFGDTWFDVLFTYYTHQHRHRNVNGYSGVVPRGYEERTEALYRFLENPEAAWAALKPATHVVIHTGAWHNDTGHLLRAFLESRGARVAVADLDGAWVYELPVR